jgi:hypothetical protein
MEPYTPFDCSEPGCTEKVIYYGHATPVTIGIVAGAPVAPTKVVTLKCLNEHIHNYIVTAKTNGHGND